MSALQAAGGGLPLGLHIPHVVEQAGSLAGFAAILGLAVLSALYFSQARDLRRLREWAGRAPERAAEGGPVAPAAVPGRVVATPQRPAQAAAVAPAAPANGAPGAAPAPAGAQRATNGDAAPSVTAAPGSDAAKQAEPDAPDVQESGDAAKTGMPAPASAAAAASAGAAAATAGAGAASAAGPSAPPPPAPSAAGASAPGGSAPAAPAPAGVPQARTPGSSAPAPGAPSKPPPERPPGSVLPPRTGTLPPVRRLPSSNVGGASTQTGILGQAPPQKKKRNPLYVVLAVAGVLVIGAAAAIGVPAIVNGSKNDNKSSKSTTHRHSHSTKTAAATSPSKITVAVLNGTSIPGLAAQVGDRVQADGFTKGTVSNASLTQGQRANSVVMYSTGHQKDAATVARRLSIRTVQPVDAQSQQIAGDATVVVLVGTDKTQ